MSQLKVDSIIPVGGVASGQAGGVVQVFQYSTTTEAETSGTTYVDTNLSGSITPLSANNKILVCVSQQIALNTPSGTGNGGGLRLLRDSTVIQDGGPHDSTGPFTYFWSGGNVNALSYHFRHNVQVLDSPATTSSITYKTQFRVYGATTTLKAQISKSTFDGESFLTLMEVSA